MRIPLKERQINVLSLLWTFLGDALSGARLISGMRRDYNRCGYGCCRLLDP